MKTMLNLNKEGCLRIEYTMFGEEEKEKMGRLNGSEESYSQEISGEGKNSFEEIDCYSRYFFSPSSISSVHLFFLPLNDQRLNARILIPN